MVLTREMELVARSMYLEKKIRGFLHVYVGQVCIIIVILLYKSSLACDFDKNGLFCN